MATRITGFAAIALAEEIGAELSIHARGREPSRDGVSVEEARAIAASDPARVYLDVDEPAPGDTRLA